MSDNTLFIQMPRLDCEAAPLGGVVLTIPLPPSQAIKEFESSALKWKEKFSHTYTPGHYGQENHLWELTGYEIYIPYNQCSSQGIVILWYRPLNPNAAALFYGDPVDQQQEHTFQHQVLVH